jgi:hypothetical protein
MNTAVLEMFKGGDDSTMTAEEVTNYLANLESISVEEAPLPEAEEEPLPELTSTEAIQFLADNKDVVDEADGSKDGNFSILGLVALSQNADGKYDPQYEAAADSVLKDEGIMSKIDGEKDFFL